MREIKFRAWEEKSGRYIDEGFSISMDGTCLYFEDCNEIILSEYPEITIEQFTGIRDKNGKEIYEGDILKSEIYTIVAGPCFHAMQAWKVKSCEVIGNIHENPELLVPDNA